MRYHNITKDDMLNGEVCEPSYGLQDAPTNAKAATIQSHGISKGEFHLMMQQRRII